MKEMAIEPRGPAAIAQTHPSTQDQQQRFICLKGGKLSAATVLNPLMADPWWGDRMRRVWSTAAKESLAAPAMQEIEATLQSATAEERAVAAAWSKAQDKLSAWRDTLRPGCTNRILTIMANHLGQTLRMLAAIALADRDDNWMAKVDMSRMRATWFKNQCNIAASGSPPLAATCVSTATDLENLALKLLAETSAHMKFEKGLALLKTISEGTDSSLAQITEMFRGCAGLKASETAASAMLDAVAHLGEGQVTTSHAELATVLLSLIPGTDAVSHLQVQWELTHEGLQAADLYNSLGSAYAATVEQRAAVAAALEKWLPKWNKIVDADGNVTNPSGLAASQTVLPQLQHAVTAMQSWQRAAFEQQVEAAAASARAATEALKLFASGAKDGASWKANLAGDCSWEDIERAAAYHLTKEQNTQLDKHFAQAQKALEALLDVAAVAMVQPPDGVREALEEAMTQARVTGTERFLMEVLCSGRSDKKANKIQNRVASMAKHNVPEDHIHPMIWEKAMAAVAC